MDTLNNNLFTMGPGVFIKIEMMFISFYEYGERENGSNV